MKTLLFLMVLFIPFGSVSAKIQDEEIAERRSTSDQEIAQSLGITFRQYRVYANFLQYGEELKDLPVGPPMKKAAQSILSLSQAITAYRSQVVPQMKHERDAGRKTISPELGEKFKTQVILTAVFGIQNLVDASVEMRMAVDKMEYETCGPLRDAESNTRCMLKFDHFHKIILAFVQTGEKLTSVVDFMLIT